MRVLALLTDAFGGEGGIARFNREWLSAMAALPGLQIDALCLGRREAVESMPANVSQQSVSGGRAGFVLHASKHLIPRYRYSLIFCGHVHLVFVAAVLAQAKRIPLWLQLHGIEAWRRPSPIRRWGVGRATLVTTVSRHTRAQFLAWATTPVDQVKVLPNTVGPRFRPGPKPAALMEHHHLTGKRILLTVGRLAATEQYKGQDSVIRAMPGLLRTFPDLCYVIAGNGDDRGRLEDLACAQQVEASVRFIGPVDEELLPDVYRMADVFVMPSTGEGFGIVYLEAAACGVPIVAGSADGGRDPAGDGRRGALVEPDNSEALREAIAQALTRPISPDAEPFARARFRGHVARLCEQVARVPAT